LTFRVELTEAAAAQVEAAIAWWRDNRPRAVALLETELEYTFELLEKLPPSTQVWDEIEGKPVRKARLPRTRYALYFTVVGDLVTIHALWHGARAEGPPLP
jgi:plasmid stabilization system protein ParE